MRGLVLRPTPGRWMGERVLLGHSYRRERRPILGAEGWAFSTQRGRRWVKGYLWPVVIGGSGGP